MITGPSQVLRLPEIDAQNVRFIHDADHVWPIEQYFDLNVSLSEVQDLPIKYHVFINLTFTGFDE